jgi:mannose-6-phosphate isomerase-like protein (cupin superfamily)
VVGVDSSGARVTAPGDGPTFGPADGVRDRFLLEASASGGALAVVEHLLAPRSLAAPMHLHTREDEYSYVLEGSIGARLGDDEVVADAGAFLVKPRGQWHTFWNAGHAPARLLEIIVPGGLDTLFRTLDLLAEWPAADELARMAAEYGARVDLDATMPIVERHGLSF